MRKLKIFLVDDEPIAVRHFRRMLDENSEIYEFIGSAGNGAAAFSQIKVMKPDLVFSDVQMPVMDGLELGQKIKQEFPLIKVVLLTAYKDFSYAQKGMNAGVYAYLVKQEITRDQIEELVCRVYKEVLLETEQKRAYLEKNMKAFLENEREVVGMNLGYENHNFLLLDVVARQPICLSGICEKQVEFPIKRLEEELRTEDIFCKMALRVSGNICLVLLFLKKSLLGQSYYYQMNRIFNMIRSYMGEEGIDVVLLISELLQHYADIPMAYRKQRKREPYIYVDKSFHWLYSEENVHSEESYQYFSQLKEIIFQNESAEEKSEILKDMFEAGRKVCSVKQYLNELNFLAMHMILWGETLHISKTQNWKEERLQIFSTLEEVEAWIEGIYSTCVKAQEEKTRVRYSETVVKFMDLVGREYARQLTSEDICAYLEISESHFRRIFKQEVGLKPMEYLNKYRIEEAKQLLQDGKYRIQEIYERVGFTSSQYFSTVFKKYTGVSPWQYQQKKGWTRNAKDNPL